MTKVRVLIELYPHLITSHLLSTDYSGFRHFIQKVHTKPHIPTHKAQLLTPSMLEKKTGLSESHWASFETKTEEETKKQVERPSAASKQKNTSVQRRGPKASLGTPRKPTNKSPSLFNGSVTEGIQVKSSPPVASEASNSDPDTAVSVKKQHQRWLEIGPLAESNPTSFLSPLENQIYREIENGRLNECK